MSFEWEIMKYYLLRFRYCKRSWQKAVSLRLQIQLIDYFENYESPGLAKPFCHTATRLKRYDKVIEAIDIDTQLLSIIQ